MPRTRKLNTTKKPTPQRTPCTSPPAVEGMADTRTTTATPTTQTMEMGSAGVARAPGSRKDRTTAGEQRRRRTSTGRRTQSPTARDRQSPKFSVPAPNAVHKNRGAFDQFSTPMETYFPKPFRFVIYCGCVHSFFCRTVAGALESVQPRVFSDRRRSDYGNCCYFGWCSDCKPGPTGSRPSDLANFCC